MLNLLRAELFKLKKNKSIVFGVLAAVALLLLLFAFLRKNKVIYLLKGKLWNLPHL